MALNFLHQGQDSLESPAERISVRFGQHRALAVVVVPALDGQELPAEEAGDIQLGLHHGQAAVVRPGQWSKMTGSHCCGWRWVLCGRDLCCGIPVVWRWFHHLLGQDAERSVALSSSGSAPT